MEDKKFEVVIYYTGYYVYEIAAQDETEAILKARILPLKQNELLTNLQNWENADTATKIENEESKI